jgi:hypothetical protein
MKICRQIEAILRGIPPKCPESDPEGGRMSLQITLKLVSTCTSERRLLPARVPRRAQSVCVMMCYNHNKIQRLLTFNKLVFILSTRKVYKRKLPVFLRIFCLCFAVYEIYLIHPHMKFPHTPHEAAHTLGKHEHPVQSHYSISSLDFSIDLILPAAEWPSLGLFILLTEMSTRNIPESNGGCHVRLLTSTPSVSQPYRQCGCLDIS